MVETCTVDSPLGRWSHSHWVPPAGDALVGIVQRIWDFEGTLAASRERIFPSGFVELVIQLDEPHRPGHANDVEPFPALCVDGLTTRTSTIAGPAGKCRVLGLSLHPCGAYRLLRTELRDLSNQTVDLRAVIGRAADEFAERVHAARRGTDRLRIAEGWLREGLARGGNPNNLVVRVVDRIDCDPSGAILKLDELAGRSRSRLAAAFCDHVGLTPKRYAKVVRFRRALELLNTSRFSLSGIASACGYYDQAHMSNEFREHAGLSPRAYAEALRYPNSNHLAEPI